MNKKIRMIFIVTLISFTMFFNFNFAQLQPILVLMPHVSGVGVGSHLQLTIIELEHSEGNQLRWQRYAESNYLADWQSSDTSIARVGPHGKVIGIREGSATITASVLPIQGSRIILRCAVHVGAIVAGVQSSNNVSLSLNCTIPIEAQPVNSVGQAINDRPVTWENLSPEIMTILPLSPTIRLPQQPNANEESIRNVADTFFFHRTASVMGRSVGDALIRITCEGVTSNLTVHVLPSEIQSLQLAPANMELDIQETRIVSVIAFNAAHCRVPIVPVNWSVENVNIATVNALTREVKGLSVGTTTITATAENGVTASLKITVPAVCFINLNPSQINDLDIGEENKRQIIATALSCSGKELPNRILNWNSEDMSIVTIDPISGYTTFAKGNKPGDTLVTVTESHEEIKATIPVTVPHVTSITIEPQSASIKVGDPQILTATPLSMSLNALTNRIITWIASNNCVTPPNPIYGYTTTVIGNSRGDVTVNAICQEDVGSPVVGAATINVKCSGASLTINCRQPCGPMINGVCQPNQGSSFIVRAEIENVEPENCEDNLIESDSQEHGNNQNPCNVTDCHTNIVFSFSSLKPGTWRIRVFIPFDIVQERSVHLAQGEEKNISI